jgi:hypothetical protein
MQFTWIPVSQEQPPKDGACLVAIASKGCVAPMVSGIIQNQPGVDWLPGLAVTHWAPMPVAPIL